MIIGIIFYLLGGALMWMTCFQEDWSNEGTTSDKLETSGYMIFWPVVTFFLLLTFIYEFFAYKNQKS